MTPDPSIDLNIRESSGIDRGHEPVSLGIPFPKGLVRDPGTLSLLFDGRYVPFAARALNLWPDGSVKWGLIDFQATVAANSESAWRLDTRPSQGVVPQTRTLVVEEEENIFTVDTGRVRFVVDRTVFRPFRRVGVEGRDVVAANGCRTELTLPDGKRPRPVVTESRVESASALKAVLFFSGHFEGGGIPLPPGFRARLSFYAGHATVRCDLTLVNPNAARHPGGLWDLGDAGSLLFKDLSLAVEPAAGEAADIVWNERPDGQIHTSPAVDSDGPMTLVVYQDSSGGKNWRYRTHINRNGQIPLTFRGYRVEQNGAVVSEGLRATPAIAFSSHDASVAGTIKEFWQNFPKAIDFRDGRLVFRPFPEYHADLYELQGGEQKTHTMYLRFGETPADGRELAWVHDPLRPTLPPEWYARTGALPFFVPQKDVPDVFPYAESIAIKDCCVHGDNTLFDRRETIDEYGWRNFGDQYADHENLLFQGEKPIVSHYNNQYDLIYSFLYQFAATGECRWFQLAEELARHAIDIDIYHTDQDTYRYNHGLFWHTDHYCDAHTATHRSYSRRTLLEKGLKDYGGGPSYEHIYVQGLATFYFMTGEEAAKEAAMELARFAVSGVEGPDTPKQVAKELVKTNLKALRRVLGKDGVLPFELLEGPGRASGNTLAAILDAYLLTADRSYLDCAEYMILRCVHPEDDLGRLHLGDVNMRWAYTLFFQSVGRYLEIKVEAGETDGTFCYARDSLLHYADWMVANERPFLSQPELLDYPNYATRACTDMRKNNVLLHAARYGARDRADTYRERGEFFFANSVKDLLGYESRFWTRPLTILMQNMRMPVFAASRAVEILQDPSCRWEAPGRYRPRLPLVTENLRLLRQLRQMITRR